MSIAIHSFIILFTTAIVYFAGERFSKASSRFGDLLKLPKTVKGVTFDAIGSSMPEFMIAIFSVVAFQKFEVGMGTIVGSALFNLLIIPAISVLVAPVVFKVSADVLYRDGMFYLMAVFALLSALLIKSVWGFVIPILFLALYAWYIFEFVVFTQNSNHEPKKERISVPKEAFFLVLTLIIIGVSTYFLTDSAIFVANYYQIPAFFVAFFLVSAATSLPDAIISILNARKGDVDDSAANVLGSNTFNILVGLGVPLIIANIIAEPMDMSFEHIELVLGLLGSTILVLYFIARDYIISKKEAYCMLGVYALFILYIAFLL